MRILEGAAPSCVLQPDAPKYDRPSLQGELVAENGTMSGGGNRVMRGRMRLGSKAPMVSQQSQQDVTQADARLQELEQTLQEQQRDLAENEAAAKAAQEALCVLSTDQQKEELAVQSLLRKVQNLKNQQQKIEADIAVRSYPCSLPVLACWHGMWLMT